MKPPVFCYTDYVNLKRTNAELSERVEELEREVLKLRNDKTNLEIRCRILEADRGEAEAAK